MKLRGFCLLLLVVASALGFAACSSSGSNAPLSDAAYVDRAVALVAACDAGQPADSAALGKALKQQSKAWSALRPPSKIAAMHNLYVQALGAAADAYLKAPTTPADRATASALLDSALARYGDWYAAFNSTYADSIFTVESASMEPALITGVPLPVHAVEGTIKRWALVIFKSPADPSRDVVRRIVGLPGETVEVHDGKVFVNGAAVNGDTYAKDATHYTYASHTIPADSYWVLGDDRGNSADSHAWGAGCDPQQPCDFVPKAAIRGVLPANTKGCKAGPIT
jgi:signal peptidase I